MTYESDVQFARKRLSEAEAAMEDYVHKKEYDPEHFRRLGC